MKLTITIISSTLMKPLILSFELFSQSLDGCLRCYNLYTRKIGKQIFHSN